MAVAIESNMVSQDTFSSPLGRHIIEDASGNLWIIYSHNGNMYIRKSTDSGSTWASAIVGYTSSDPSTDYIVETAMVYNSNVIYAIYHTAPEDKLYARSFNTTTESWNADQTELTGMNTPFANIVIDRDFNGKLWVGYVKYTRYSSTPPTCTYYVRRSTNNDDVTTWGSDVNLGNSGSSYDGYGQLSIHCRNNGTTDEVLALYGKWTASSTYTVYSRLNDGAGNNPTDWASEQSTGLVSYISLYMNDGRYTDDFYRFRTHKCHSAVRLDATNFYLVTITAYNTIRACQFTWSTDTWSLKDTGFITAYVYQIHCVSNASTIRTFLGYSAILGYTDYTIGTDLWNDTTTTLESEGVYNLCGTEYDTILNDNRILYSIYAEGIL